MNERPSSLLKLAVRIGLGLALCLPASMAAAEPSLDGTTITVNSFGDDLALNGNCTLREAIQAANTDIAVDACPAGNGADTILLPAGTITMAIRDAGEDVPEDDANLSGDFDITSAITIEGAGMDATTLDGDHRLRAFDVFPGAALTLRNFELFEAVFYSQQEDENGAIQNYGTLVLDHVRIERCGTDNVKAADSAPAGAVYNRGTLTIGFSEFIGNWTEYDGNGAAMSSRGNLVIDDSLFENNGAYDGAFDHDGPVTIRRTVFRNNDASEGLAFGIYGDPLLIEDSRFEGIVSGGDWQGIALGGDVTIRRTQFVHNDFLTLGGTVLLDEVSLDRTPLDSRTSSLVVRNSTLRASMAQLAYIAGPAPNYWVGLLRVNEGTVRLENSTLTANNSSVEVAGGTLTIVNSTLSGNDLTLDPYYADAIGWDSLIEMTGGSLVIESSTITNNHGDYALHVKSGTATVLNSILNATHWPGTTNHTDCKVEPGASLTSRGYNIVSIATGCGWIASSTDQVGSTASPRVPGLFGLADNGGPTLTHALRDTSIALDTGHPSLFPLTDQRGEVRPMDGDGNGVARVDIGAFEAATVPPKLDQIIFLPQLGR